MSPMHLRRPGAIVAMLVAVALVLAGCSSGSSGDAQPRATTTPSPSASTSSSASSDAPPPAVANVQPCPDDPDREFSFRAGPYSFEGYTRGRGKMVVILLHQSRGTPCDLAGLAARLHQEGYRTVSWTADPGTSVVALGLLVKRERRRGATEVVLLGASAGGATSLVAAGAIKPPIDAVVALSPSSQDRGQGDVVRSIARYQGPVMVVAAEFDPSFADVPGAVGAAHHGPELVTVYPGISDHGKQLVALPDSPVADDVVEFLAAH